MTDLTAEDLAYGDAELYAFPAQIGWNVIGADTPTRLYALDAGEGPRWQSPPRAIERAIDEAAGPSEGARAVVVLVGGREVPDDLLERCRAAAAAAVLQTLRAVAAAPDVTAELDHAVRLRPATEGRPEDGPYPTSVGEVAAEVVAWIRDHEQYAARLGEQVGARLATAPDVTSDRAAIERVRAHGKREVDDPCCPECLATARGFLAALDGETTEES